ncbi:MAG: Hsp20/alpha crystallin family protein [Candidatus Micrarchaeia archaeon]
MAKKNENALPRILEDPLGYWNSIAKEFSMPLRASIFGSMPIDLIDEGNAIRIKAEMPGIQKGDIKLNVTKSSVSIRAESKNEEEKKGKNYYYSERRSSGYYRSIDLPVDIDPKSVKAKLENGILEITAKKVPGESAEIKVE